MQAIWLTGYVLVWPVLTLGVLGVLTASVLKDVMNAKSNGESLV